MVTDLGWIRSPVVSGPLLVGVSVGGATSGLVPSRLS